MKLIRRFGVFGVLGACWLVAAGCGDDDAKKSVSDGGSGGKAGAGGKGLGGGSSKAGNTGKAGTPSLGGAPQGGAGGEGGSAVSGGPGEGPGGDGPGGNGGTAGEGGAVSGGGAGGDVAAPVAKDCAYSCAVDADCARVDEGQAGKCHPVRKQCVDPTNSCEAHDDCIAFASFWPPAACVDDAGCIAGTESCIDVAGSGTCAPRPEPETGCAIDSPVTRKRFGAVGNVVVCASPHGRCLERECTFGCSDPLFSGGCELGGGKGTVCNEVSGLCECTAASECTASGVSACGASSLCECAVDADCAAGATQTGLTKCVSGKCGCAEASTCPASFYFNAPAVCE